jgi:hypothetical protein
MAIRAQIEGLGFDVTRSSIEPTSTRFTFENRAASLFEIATDLPGFAVDEAPTAGNAPEASGWLEPQRERIEVRCRP